MQKLLRFLRSEEGLIENLATIPLAIMLLGLGIIATLLSVASVLVLDQNNVLADHVAQVFSTSGNTSSALPPGSVQAYSLQQVTNSCNASTCWYQTGCNQSQACIVYVNTPYTTPFGRFNVVTEGVAPWPG